MTDTREQAAEWCEREAAVLAESQVDGMEPLAQLIFNLLDALALEYGGGGECGGCFPQEGGMDRDECYVCHGTGFTPAGLAAWERVKGVRE